MHLTLQSCPGEILIIWELTHFISMFRAAVNVVDFDEKYIVSASGDRTIKVSLPTSLVLSLTLSPTGLVHQLL